MRFFKISKAISTLASILTMLPTPSRQHGLMLGLLPRVNASVFFPNHATRLCFRCLSPTHLVKDCWGETRCIYCFNYGHRARYCAKRRLDLKRKWDIKPSKHPSGEEHGGDGRTNYIQWSLRPNAPNDVVPSMLGSHDSTPCILSTL
jgi:hypothetical protein